MKKLFSILLISIFAFTLTGCGKTEKTEKTNTNDNEGSKAVETTKKDLSYFREEVKKLIIGSTESDAIYSMIGATAGVKIHDENEENRIEIYQFDKSTDTYKKAEANQKICIGDSTCFSAIVKNGYALIIDNDFPQKDEIVSLFNSLN